MRSRLPAPDWLRACLGPTLRCRGVLVTRSAPVLELDVSAEVGRELAEPLLVTVELRADVAQPWPFQGERIAVGFTRGAGDRAPPVANELAGELARRVGARLEGVGDPLVPWLRRVRWFARLRKRRRIEGSGDGSGDVSSEALLRRARVLLAAQALSEQERHPARALGSPERRALIDDALALARGREDLELRAAIVQLLLAVRAYGPAFALYFDAFEDLSESTCLSETREPAVCAHARALIDALRGRHGASARGLETLARVHADAADAVFRASARGLMALDRRSAAARCLERLVETAAPERAATERLGLAALLSGEGERARVVEVLRAPVDWSPSDRLRVAELLLKSGAFAEAEAHLRTCLEGPADEVATRARRRLAALALWRGQTDRARELLAVDPEPGAPALARIEGAALVLDGRYAEGLERLAVAIAGDERDGEARIWRCEALIRTGRAGQALAEIEGAVERSSSASAIVLMALCWLERGLYWRRQFRVQVRERMFLDGFLHDRFGGLLPPRFRDASEIPVGEFRAVLWEVIGRLGGNRSDLLTERVDDGKGEPQLRLLEIPTSSRAAAVDALRRITHAPPLQVLAGFAAAQRGYPWSPHPFTYRGEIRLWLGDYHEAIADFDAAERISTCRWAFVGRGAAKMMLGRSMLAELDMSKGTRMYGFLAAATTTVYRGELLRRQGKLPEALAKCQAAVAAKPSRVATWMNIALLERALGRPADAARTLARISQLAPGLLWEASRALGGQPRASLGGDDDDVEAILERALVMMRGNRSSVIQTFFTEDGDFRVMPPAERWSAHARASLAIAAEVLERVLVDALLE